MNIDTNHHLKDLIVNDDFSIQEVLNIKEEISDNINESTSYEVFEYLDCMDTSNVLNRSVTSLSLNQSIKIEIECADPEISGTDTKNLAAVNNLIDLTCTKCRRTTKNSDYFFNNKTDLQCLACKTRMKFQCPRCKLVFRQFDSAYRHARQICQIDDNSSLQLQRNQRTYKSAMGATQAADVEQGCVSATRSPQESGRRCARRERGHTGEHACPRCEKCYRSRESMMKHARLCGRAPHIRCEFCSYRTKRREHLRVHMRHKHPDPESCHGSTYDCPNCCKKYKYLMSMKSHVKHCTKGAKHPN